VAVVEAEERRLRRRRRRQGRVRRVDRARAHDRGKENLKCMCKNVIKIIVLK
jgi:hypothetical protein